MEKSNADVGKVVVWPLISVFYPVSAGLALSPVCHCEPYLSTLLWSFLHAPICSIHVPTLATILICVPLSSTLSLPISPEERQLFVPNYSNCYQSTWHYIQGDRTQQYVRMSPNKIIVYYICLLYNIFSNHFRSHFSWCYLKYLIHVE
jgi:hypothetical protein